jgi:hypothetical protein
MVCPAYVGTADEISCKTMNADRFPGDSAHDVGQCISEKFDSKNKVCVGVAKGEICSNFTYGACEPNTFCGVSGTCEDFKLKVGDKCDKYNFNGCPFFTSCNAQNATCTRYYSLENGSTVN